ncbi:MAG: tetratricopeptide repeat protein [Planctomycetes bacterium]|nr:tetratricopeptide repeat protein [Planctomycetota bacterium]
MNETQKRLALYGATALVLGGIGVAAVVVETEADAVTLLSGVDVQLRLAYGIPAADKQGKPLPAREAMIDEAIQTLAVVERSSPGMAVASEFRGFAHMLRGEYGAAAECYARARGCSDCGDEQRDVLAFNQARMLRQAGDGDAALAVFAQHAAALDSRFGAQRRLEEAATLRELGRPEQALGKLDEVLADSATEPMARLQAGAELAELGRTERAEQVLTAVAPVSPVANYYLARLKLRAGNPDTAIEFLERALAAAPADTRRMIREESEAWQELSTNERFTGLTSSVPASPGR